MARMRSVKPEFWHDQEITRLPRDARLLYMAMWNLADEHSRLQGDPRYLKGQAFPYDDDLDAPAVAGLLDSLVAAGKAQRYVVRGAVYVLLPKLAKHQRLDGDKVPSRLPSPDEADPDHDPEPPAPKTESRADSSGKNPDLDADKSALSMEHVAGSMEHVSTTSGAPRTALRSVRESPHEAPTAQTIVAEWLDRTNKRPPGQVVGHVAKLIGQMLDEHIDPDDIRRGIAIWMSKGLHPSALPSTVNEAMNSAPSTGRASAKAAGWLALGTQGA